ncbi:hypothetical protein DFJ74DRAFT_687388 [Hyaloraphidium curvatum]|nr:hypothetical protein DFJ74DRAFT_687388 [Hyaloraphidium curvatum]
MPSGDTNAKEGNLLTREELSALWDEHTSYEFATRDVVATMKTMVQDCYVNHIPTLQGGYGAEHLSNFYGTSFIPSVPADFTLKPLGRIISVEDQSVVDEMVIELTHTTKMDWLLPGLEPTGKKIRFPLIAVVRFKNRLIHHEHIWWDQGAVLKQLGLLPANLPLPVYGAETADRIIEDSARIHAS